LELESNQVVRSTDKFFGQEKPFEEYSDDKRKLIVTLETLLGFSWQGSRHNLAGKDFPLSETSIQMNRLLYEPLSD
jgi:hypothetical protein